MTEYERYLEGLKRVIAKVRADRARARVLQKRAEREGAILKKYEEELVILIEEEK